MHLFYQPEAPTIAALTEDDSRHAVKTLRLGMGDEILVTNGQGRQFAGVITKADHRQCAFRITEEKITPARPFSIRICVAPTKNLDRIEWFVEKAVELGIEQISFFFSQHSERRVLKTERIEKIAVSAMKQSLQSWMPRIDEAVSFKQLLASVSDEGQRFLAHLPDHEIPSHLFRAAQTNKIYTVLIGPEGDFAEQEIQQALQAGFRMVTLGPNRLRTETAALAACQMLNLLNQ
ncbi:16S rRNA (uracil(1498)-N(3))-methyltransferase [Arsenicibacter rosenii]|uniref:Ribosomal RNA small subunit methyltransferase E n=1 Tax=Arsenicibacter rosenii TaxID=1750698 RepID=A0A1S2VHI9_9BACT|nr:16S rRNA (uracil(1498)-N(3))-methyltransferase [Arsenicibacter rosenii]OIN57338.1 16S rRNA (uracil(1498)-N(3))-methyltransferase [Arsenicibacter rosenii]